MKLPTAKLRMIEQSRRCFVFGWWALMPGVGIVPGIAALLAYRRACDERGNQWNPAQARLMVGLVLACVGILLSISFLIGLITGMVLY